MPISHAVLALLSAEPSYGYSLKASFERTVGPQWGGLNIGHLYQVLDRLVRDGLVIASRTTQAVRPDRVMYTLTDDGRRELERWLEQPVTRAAGFRDDLALKLLAAGPRGSAAVRSVLARQRADDYARLRALTSLERDGRHEPLVALLVSAARLHTEADLRLLELAEEQADAIAATAATPRSERNDGAADTPERHTG